PNGTWSLYVRDDLGIDLGSISGGWTIRITTTACGGTATPTNTPTTTPSPFSPTPTSTFTATATGSPSCTPAGTPQVLYDQTNNAGTNATNSQDFEAANDTFDNRGADDFVVPAGQTWTVQRVVAGGQYFNGAGPAATFNVTFLSNSGSLPGTAVPGGTFTGATYTNAAGVFTITLPGSVTLTAGTYWVSVQARMDFTPAGQWGWNDRTTTTNSPAAWQNPGGGFQPPLCIAWGARGATCNIDPAAPDQIFQIVGVTGTGGCPSGTPTFTATGSPSFTPTFTATATATATPTGGPTCPPSSFSNTAAITINDNAAGAPYPSNIAVTGLTGTVTKVTVDLTGVSHTFPDDVDVMLVGPGGQNTLLMSDAGGGLDVVGVNLTFDDAAAATLPDATQIASGTFRPSNFDTTTDVFPAPAPPAGATVALSVFNGSSPNGTWSLYVRDDLGIDLGSISGGWTVRITTTGCGPTGTSTNTPTFTPTNSATPTATFTGTPPPASVQFSSATYNEDESQTAVITVNRTGNSSGTTTVNFATSNGTATGGATCAGSVDYISVAQAVTFNPGVTTQTVNVTICPDALPQPPEGPETVNLTLTGASVGSPATAVLTINDTANLFRNGTAICTTLGQPASPYPSTITVAGGPIQIGNMRVTFYDIISQFPDHLDVLLVSPTGRQMIIQSDAGGLVDLVTPVTLTFSDSAGQVLPDSAPLSTGIFEPTSWQAGQASFPAPAPPAPYNEPGSTVGGTPSLASVFGLSNANGVWSLYVRDDAGLFAPANITGCLNGGWGLEFLAGTAAQASISGRVLTANGQGIRNARIVVTGNSLVEPLVVTTGSMGYYTLDGLQTGQTYVVTVNSQRYTFNTPSRVISLVDNVADADFVADPQE
ncbi:MAG: Calx-beta domain-containing protein, partial [Pyrinomonadaceae bacterium]